MRKKAVLVIASIVIALGIGLGLYIYVKNRNTHENRTSQNSSVPSAGPNDIKTLSIDSIKNQYSKNPAQLYGVLMSEGGVSMGFKKYVDAIAYYKAAAIATDNQAFKDEANISIYYVAKASGNNALESEYKNLLGEKLTQSFKGKGNDINGQ